MRLKRHTDELESAESVILSLAKTIEARDPYAQGHCERLAGYATALGERLCGDLRSLEDVRPIIRHHHERRDGSGYPDGLSGDAIPLLAQIIAVVDTYDAITTTRPYRKARPSELACTELLAGVKQNHFRPDLVEAFVEMGRAGELEAIARGVSVPA